MSVVLVLNQDYSPLTVCSAQRAFVLLFLDKAELLSELKEKRLRTVSTSFPFPSVIRINRYIHIPYKGVVLSRHNIFKRDGNKCQYCGKSSDLTLDHVIPRSKGGKSSWTNLVTACRKCNAKKGDDSPEKAGMKLLKIPAKPSYLSFLRMNTETVNKDWMPYLDPKKASA